MYVTCIKTIEQHEESAIFIIQTAIKLYCKSMCFSPNQIVVMYCDMLTWHQLVRDQVDFTGKATLEFILYSFAQLTKLAW